MLEALISTKAINKGTLIKEYTNKINEASRLLNNALENDKILVVGREAQKIAEYTETLEILLEIK